MTDALYRRFPDHIEIIKELRKRDATFQEICSDFEKLSSWLADYCRSAGLPSEQCAHARELVKDLEGEIIRALTESE